MLRNFALALVALFSLLACNAEPGEPEDQRGPVILAAASLQEALEEAADRFADGGNTRPTLSFAGTPAIARQVQQGAPADLIVTADAQWMDEMEKDGLIDRESRRDIAGNRLVLIASGEMDDLPQDASLRPFLAIADPASVPAGRYAKAALQSAGMWDAAEGRATDSESVRAALLLVERGEAPFGVVYRSDMLASGKVREVLEFPESSHPPIRYPAALLASSDSKTAADFLAFLLSADGQAIFRKHGFSPAS